MTGRLACACELVDATSTQVIAPAAQLNGLVAIGAGAGAGAETMPGVGAVWGEGGEDRRWRWSSNAESEACADSTPSAALSLPPPQADKVTKKSRLASPLRQPFLIVRS